MSTPLPTSRLGSDGPEITRVGFGAWAAGGGGWSFSWGPQDDGASVRAIRHALAKGVNWIDTAAVYGYGHSEEVVGRAVADIPPSERPLIFTKCGLRWDDGDRMKQPDRLLEPAAIRSECEASLRRLGVERIDLYQFHWSDPATAVEDSWGEMQRLVAEGKVRWAGVSNFGVDLLERCDSRGHVESLQPPFSMIRRGAAEDLLPWCAAHGTGVIVYSPMQSGLLTDSFSVERVSRMAEDDWRPRHSDEFRAPKLEAWDHGRSGLGRLDARVARGHRRHRGGALPGAGGRLAGGGDADARRARPRGDRRGHRAHGGRLWPNRAHGGLSPRRVATAHVRLTVCSSSSHDWPGPRADLGARVRLAPWGRAFAGRADS